MDKKEMAKLDWDKNNGLIPVVVQDDKTLQVLMLGYMNEEALNKTITSGKVTFFSRSKQRLWQKGEESGNFLEMVDIIPDCDNDTLLVFANPVGPTCHCGTTSCFGENEAKGLGWLAYLENIITDRNNNRSKKSYTSKLFDEGISRIAQKVGEEGIEVVLASVDNKQNFEEEAADLIFHLLILLQAKNTNLNDIVQILQKRHNAPK